MKRDSCLARVTAGVAVGGAIGGSVGAIRHKKHLCGSSENKSEISMSQCVASEGTEHANATYPSLDLGNSVSFKFEDHKGRVYRFNFGFENLCELVSAVMQRVGASNDQICPQLLMTKEIKSCS